MYEALLNKARRGESIHATADRLREALPRENLPLIPTSRCKPSYAWSSMPSIGKARVRGVLRYLVQHSITLPIRPHTGPNRGNIEWRRPTRDAVTTILTHPLYAGTYRYGFRQIDPRRKNPEKRGSGRVVMNPEDYHALIPNHCPGLHHGGTFRTEPATFGGEPMPVLSRKGLRARAHRCWAA